MNYIQKLIYKRKKRILFSDFAKKVKKIAEKDGKVYYNVSITYSHHIDTPEYKQNEGTMTFSCYVDGYSHYSGKTMLEAIENLENQIKKPKKESIKEIVI